MSAAQPRELAPLLVTMGDACGIGPEIVAKAWAAGELPDAVVVADVGVMRRALAVAGLAGPVARIDAPADLGSVPAGALPVWQPEGLPPGLATLPWGRIAAEAGAGASRRQSRKPWPAGRARS
jgi:4-hydroxythreonine-4-phosphate dehydrogenase